MARDRRELLDDNGVPIGAYSREVEDDLDTLTRDQLIRRCRDLLRKEGEHNLDRERMLDHITRLRGEKNETGMGGTRKRIPFKAIEAEAKRLRDVQLLADLKAGNRTSFIQVPWESELPSVRDRFVRLARESLEEKA